MQWPIYFLIISILFLTIFFLIRKSNRQPDDKLIRDNVIKEKQRISGIHRTYKHIIFTYCKEHNCPNCNSLLRRVKASKVVNSKSPEAIFYDFSGVDYPMRGNIKFFWDEFICDNCGLQILPEKLKQIESNRTNK